MSKTIVALYKDLPTAEQVVQELVARGFQREEISFTVGDQDSDSAGRPVSANDAEYVAGGASAGAVLGGLAGWLVGIGALAIPGIGPIVAAGPLAAALIGAGVGAMAGGLVGALVQIGVPEEQAELYAEGVRRGNVLLALAVPEAQVTNTINVLASYGPIDIEERRDEGQVRNVYEETASSATNMDAGALPDSTNYSPSLAAASSSQPEASQGIEPSDDEGEGRSNSPREVGRMETLTDEEADTYTRPTDSIGEPTFRPSGEGSKTTADDAQLPYVQSSSGHGYSGSSGWRGRESETTEVPGTRNMTSDYTGTAQPYSSIRPESSNEPDGYNDFLQEFQVHYDSTYGDRDFEYYGRAYRYGCELAAQPAHRGRSWETVKADAEKGWWKENSSDWSEIEEAVYYAWQRVANQSDERGNDRGGVTGAL